MWKPYRVIEGLPGGLPELSPDEFQIVHDFRGIPISPDAGLNAHSR